MRTSSIFILFVAISFCFSACKKDEGPVDNGEDLTTSIVGDYVGQLTGGIGGAFGQDHQVTVKKVNNTTVNISPTVGGDSRSWDQVVEKAENFDVNQRIQSNADDVVSVTFTINTNAIQYDNDGEFYNGSK